MAKNFTQRNNRAYAVGNPLLEVFPEPIISERAPTVNDIAELGRSWIDVPNQDAYTLVSILSGQATWVKSGAAEGEFTELEVTPGFFNYNGIGSAFTMTSDTASSIGTTGAGIDLTLASAAGRVVVDGGEAAADAVRIIASNAAGGIDIDAGTNGIAADSTGQIAITSSLGGSEGAIQFNIAAADSSLKVLLGDDAGGSSFDIRDSVNNSVANINSDGKINGQLVNVPTTTADVGQFQINDLHVLHASGGNCIFVGSNAGSFTGNKANCTGLGAGALANINDATSVIGIGLQAGNLITDGNNNIFIGNNSGSGITTGTDNIMIHHHVGGPSLGAANSNNIYVGHEGNDESGTIRIGTATAQTVCYIQGIFGGTGSATAVLIDSDGLLGTAPSSIRYKENVEDMADESNALLSLRPVVFNYKSDASKSLQYGLIAEEVYEVMPRLAVLDKEGRPETVKYHELPALLLNELQKALKRIEALEAQLAK